MSRNPSPARDARAKAALARVDERVRLAVESAPPLPDALRHRLTELIRSTRVPSELDDKAVAA